MYIYGGYQDLKGSTSELWAFHFGKLTGSRVARWLSYYRAKISNLGIFRRALEWNMYVVVFGNLEYIAAIVYVHFVI
jgi:hypothetical protein